jgi:ribosomal protein S18 acetylase RimI-like enzyme
VPLTSAIAEIEEAFETHWRHFGLYPGARLCDEDGVLRLESPIAHLPYNAVIRSRIAEDRADAVAQRVDAGFRARDVPYMWVVRPSDTPPSLGVTLSRLGLDLVEVATGMDLELAGWRPVQPAPEASIVEVSDERGLSDYEELIRTYWSVPESEREMIRTLNRYWWGPRNPGVRLVAYVAERPVAKLFLNLRELPARASVYGVAVLPEARGKGIATSMMAIAMARARAAGATKMVLHSSRMARSLYQRMGFAERCQLLVYATAPVFGTHHH